MAVLTPVPERDTAERALVDTEKAFGSLSALWLERSRERRDYREEEKALFDSILDFEKRLPHLILQLRESYGLGDK